jgi:hypothetical protein
VLDLKKKFCPGSFLKYLLKKAKIEKNRSVPGSGGWATIDYHVRLHFYQDPPTHRHFNACGDEQDDITFARSDLFLLLYVTDSLLLYVYIYIHTYIYILLITHIGPSSGPKGPTNGTSSQPSQSNQSVCYSVHVL